MEQPLPLRILLLPRAAGMLAEHQRGLLSPEGYEYTASWRFQGPGEIKLILPRNLRAIYLANEAFLPAWLIFPMMADARRFNFRDVRRNGRMKRWTHEARRQIPVQPKKVCMIFFAHSFVYFLPVFIIFKLRWRKKTGWKKNSWFGLFKLKICDLLGVLRRNNGSNVLVIYIHLTRCRPKL